jgi:iron(III) transport system substrate-binding protein
MAFKAGHFPTDVANNLGAALAVFREEGVLDDLRILPSFKNLEPVMRDDRGIWAAYRQQYWCLAYNTKLIKEADLPQKWEDILGNPKFQGKNLAIGNRANLWMYMLWAYHGEDWTTKYIKSLFNEVKPQLRKEGVGAMVSLLAIGEFAATIPASGPHVDRVREKGGPVGYHCPEPVPVSFAAAGIIKGNPHIDASRIYLNWLLSKEGQLSQFLHVGDSVPVHRDLQRKEFGVVQNRKIAGRSDDTLTTIGPKVDKVWDSNWR